MLLGFKKSRTDEVPHFQLYSMNFESRISDVTTRRNICLKGYKVVGIGKSWYRVFLIWPCYVWAVRALISIARGSNF
jgi:hypothetical protein